MMEWQWHQLDHLQIICTSPQTDNHTNTSLLSFLQAGCPYCCPTNSVKALKAFIHSCVCAYEFVRLRVPGFCEVIFDIL